MSDKKDNEIIRIEKEYLYKMGLHEEFERSDLSILRVPGGWIYTRYLRPNYEAITVFVPFDDEFKPKH